MSNTAPSFEAKKPLPLPKLTSSTWKRTSGTVPFLSLQTASAMALGADKPLAWETATAHFQLRHPQNSFEYSMGSKCVDVSVPARQSGQQGVTETLHKIFLSLLSAHKSFQGLPCQKWIILNSLPGHVRYSQPISLASSEHCQISLKAG